MESKILEILNKHSESRPSAFTVTFNGVVNDKIIVIPKYNFETAAHEIASLLPSQSDMVNKEEMRRFAIWYKNQGHKLLWDANGDFDELYLKFKTPISK